MTSPTERLATGPTAGSRMAGQVRAVNALGLGLLTWGAVTGLPGAGDRRGAAVAALVLAVVGWLSWLAGRQRAWFGSDVVGAARPGDTALLVATTGAMAVGGGVLAASDPVALFFVGVAALSATTARPLVTAGPVVAAGPVALVVAQAVTSGRVATIAEAFAAAIAGAAVGMGRRDGQLRAAQASLAQVNAARADAERARAELLAGRNHLARELHDVLAHTLSALSLHLEALDALVDAGPSRAADVRAELTETRRLVRAGLDEARGAVRALRDDLGPLDEHLARLAGATGGTVEVRGTPRRLAPDVALALYRVAQEACTNATRHAAARASVLLEFADHEVSLTVTNPLPAGGVAGAMANGGPAGGGYGLQGIRERILLVGGRVDTGPDGATWRVRAEVPA